MPSLSELLASHRILLSRLFAILFFLILIFSRNKFEEYLISDLLFLFGLILIGIATTGRLWCSLYISGHKNEQLITEGPYSITRNPLYFFSFLGFIGIASATKMVTFVIVALVVFPIIYSVVIQHEEEFLRGKFGTAFEEYSATTPRFFPKFSRFHEPASYSVNTRLFRRSMLDAMWFIWLVGIIELVEALHQKNLIPSLIRLP